MNKSGIEPCANRILVKPDDVERTTEGGIIIPDPEADRHLQAQTTGVLMAVGPDVYKESTTVTERLIDGNWKVVERTTTGYSEPFANIGDRVAFAKHGGQISIGADGEEYRLLNDLDITARVNEDVSFTGFKSRKRMST